MKLLKDRIKIWEDPKTDDDKEYIEGTRPHPYVESQKHYDSLLQAQLEKVSAETEMELHDLAEEQLLRDSASFDSSLSDAEKRDVSLEKTKIAEDMLTAIAHLEKSHSRIESSEWQIDSDSRWRDRCDDFDSKRFLREVYNYTAFTGLLDFAKKPVFSQGVTQVSLLFPNCVAISHEELPDSFRTSREWISTTIIESCSFSNRTISFRCSPP